MNRIKKLSLKAIPFLSASLLGTLIYAISLSLNDDLKSLLINISAAFIGIPLVFLGYQFVNEVSHKRLNKEIADYAKVQIDQEIIGIINHLMKYVFPYNKIDKTPYGINSFMNLSLDQIEKELHSNSYIGFQILRKWDIKGQKIRDLLTNVLIIKAIDDDKLETIIRILKHLNYFDSSGELESKIRFSHRYCTEYSFSLGTDLNNKNGELPNRYLLTKNIDNNHGKVIDFGDFERSEENKLLRICQYKETKEIANSIFSFISEINTWIKLCNGELLIDPKYIRVRYVEDDDNNI